MGKVKKQNLSGTQGMIPELRFPEFEGDGEWVERKLGKMTSKVGSGKTPKGGNENYKSSGRPFVRSQNIGWGILLLDDMAFIDEKTHSTFLSSEIKLNDVLLNITGASIGRSAIANEIIEKGNVNQHVCIIRTKKGLNSVFLNQYLISHYGQKQIDSFQAGGNRQGLNFSQIRSLEIPTPPKLEEQQKIAGCLSSLDELMAAHNDRLAALKDHKKGLLQNLFPDPAASSGGETVPKIRFPEFEGDGEWVERKLGDVADLTSSKRVHLADYVETGVPFFRGKEISELKKGVVPSDILFISEDQYSEIKDKYGVPRVGDILITAVGTLGNVYRVINDDRFYFKDGNLIWMKEISISSAFLEILLEAKKVDVLSTAIGSSQKALTMKALNKLILSVPQNPQEQQKIASCLSAVDALITDQQEKIEQLQQHKKGLMQGLFPRISD